MSETLAKGKTQSTRSELCENLLRLKIYLFAWKQAISTLTQQIESDSESISVFSQKRLQSREVLP